jgi:hypothetical protein
MNTQLTIILLLQKKIGGTWDGKDYIIGKKKEFVEQGEGNQADITASGVVDWWWCAMWTGARHAGTPHSARQIRVAGRPTRQPTVARRQPTDPTALPLPGHAASVHRPRGPAHLAHAPAWGRMSAFAARAVWPRAPGLRGRQRPGCLLP